MHKALLAGLDAENAQGCNHVTNRWVWYSVRGARLTTVVASSRTHYKVPTVFPLCGVCSQEGPPTNGKPALWPGPPNERRTHLQAVLIELLGLAVGCGQHHHTLGEQLRE